VHLAYSSSDPPIFVNIRSQTGALTGVQRYTRELCRRLNGRIHVVAPQRELHGITGHLWEQMVLPGIVKGNLLWSPANIGPLTVARQVLTIHDLASLDHPEWFDRRFAIWYRSIIPLLARRVRHIITVSEFSKQRLVELTQITESRVSAIPNGVDARFRPKSTNEIRQVGKKIGIPSTTYLLSVSSLEPRKNLKRLLEAWRMSAPRLPKDAWLVIAGTEGKDNIFRATSLEPIPSKVLFAGFVSDDDLPALYTGAVALVYPSIYEGFGLPALEAMAAGTVPIVAKSTSLLEVVGDAGLLIDPFCVEDLSDSIIRIVEDCDLRIKLSRRGIARAREFTWERAAESTMRVLTEAAAD
jgi:glycosyltransferase involved in cell wall biosynthesis